jgi:hypothetical protein
MGDLNSRRIIGPLRSDSIPERMAKNRLSELNRALSSDFFGDHISAFAMFPIVAVAMVLVLILRICQAVAGWAMLLRPRPAGIASCTRPPATGIRRVLLFHQELSGGVRAIGARYACGVLQRTRDGPELQGIVGPVSRYLGCYQGGLGPHVR